jgi:hypothetical protein
MYKKIKDTYGTPGVAVVFSDFKKVLTFSLNADHNPRPAIDALQVLFDRLRTNEVDLPEFVRAMILTHAIPKSWDSIAALQMQGKAVGDIKFTTIRDAIVSEYERRANPAALNKMTNLKRKQHNPSFAQQKNSSQGSSQGSSSKSNVPPKEQGQKNNNAHGKHGNKGKGKQPAHSQHGHSLDVSTILSPAILTSHPSPLPASSASIAEISSAGINVRKVAVNLPASAYSAAAAKVDQPPSGARYPSLDYARRQCELLNIPKHAQYLRMFEDQWRARMNHAGTVANSPQMQSRQRRAECGAARAMTVDAKSCIAQKVRYNTGTGQGRLSTCIAQKRSGKERGKPYQQVYKGKDNKVSECR